MWPMDSVFFSRDLIIADRVKGVEERSEIMMDRSSNVEKW